MTRKRSEFVDYLIDQLEPRGTHEARVMFGGWGLFRGGLMWAIVSDDTLYLKADAENRNDFEQLGLLPFTYRRQGNRATLSFYQTPATALDDAEMLNRWAARSFEVALRAQKR